jgi:putative lipoic acid-binding regulatory protein
VTACSAAGRVVCCSSGQEPAQPGAKRPHGGADAVIRSLAGVSKAEGRDVSDTGRRLVLGLDQEDEQSWDALDKKVNQYPLVREFKCIGSGGEDFVTSLLAAAMEVTKRPLRREEVVVRQSRKGNYQSVCIYVDVASGEEVKAIFAALKKDTRLRYFL